MSLILPLIFGFFSSSVGIAFPGLINMTAAKVSMRDGRDRALLFVLGAVIIIFFQTMAAVFFARFIDSHPDVTNLLREVGFGVFIALTIYFFFIAKAPKHKKEELKTQSKTNRFFLGMLLSSLNLFPIPYYVFITITLASYRLFSFESMSIFIYLLGVLVGSFSVFYYYITSFVKIESKTDFFFRNINKIIGTITGIVSLITLINIIKYYF